MKIAVLSDVHGNVPALEAALEDIERWAPDEVIVNGDLVSRGPYSLECLHLIQARCQRARFLAGNHEVFVLSAVDQPCDPADPAYDLSRLAHWTAAQLGQAVEEMRQWADHIDLTDLDGGSFHVTHGSRLSNRDGIRPDTPDEELPRKLGDPRDLFIASHTHRPLLRHFNGTLLVNVGSVGQPLDGDPRAAYGRFTFSNGRWQARIARLAYDKARAEQDFVDSGFLEECGSIARLIYLEVQQSRMHVGPWVARYLEAVKASAITVTEAVDEYLAAL